MKKTMLLLAIFALGALGALSRPALAASSEDDHLISVGAGISSPSVTSAITENPAGLTNNQNFELLGEIASGNSQLNPIGFGGGLFAGNGKVGAGLTLQNFSQFNDGISGSSTQLDFGLAADITQLKIAFGVSGSYLLSSSGVVLGPGANGNLGLNAGAICNPHGDFRVGATIFGLTDSVDAVAGGISYDPSKSATLALDAAYTLGSKSVVAKPGIAIHLPELQIAVGYGFNVVNSGGGWIPTGVSLALGFPVGKKLAIQAYYNQLALYYVGVTISL